MRGIGAIIGIALTGATLAAVAASNKPAPLVSSTGYTCTPGRRYAIRLFYPPGFPAKTVAGEQAKLDEVQGAGIFRVASVVQPDAQHAVVTVDCLRAPPPATTVILQASVTPSGAAAGATLDVFDIGPTPAPPVVPSPPPAGVTMQAYRGVTYSTAYEAGDPGPGWYTTILWSDSSPTFGPFGTEAEAGGVAQSTIDAGLLAGQQASA